MNHRLRVVVLVILIAAAGAALLPAQTPSRYFDTAAASPAKVRLTVFYPSLGTLKALLALKKQGWIPIPDLEVVAVRHQKEKTDYAASEKFVRDEKLDWIKFHTITADLGPETIFKKNAVSTELEKIFSLSSGIIFFGGPDIVPALYGEKTGLLTVINDPWRHYLELTAVFHLLGGFQDPSFKGYMEKRPDFPVLGICLGMQTLNVGTGGTLIQDIWTDIYHLKTFEDAIALGPAGWHTNPFRGIAVLEKDLLPYMLHPVRFAETSRIGPALGLEPADRPYVMSAHHQAAGRIGKGLRVAAVSLDGKVVEAVEHETYAHVLGLQFHPEFPMLWETEARYKIAPTDKDLFGCRTYLEAHPPSYEFHKKLWAWFFGLLH
jgi:putative glutamine amidotransferase